MGQGEDQGHIKIKDKVKCVNMKFPFISIWQSLRFSLVYIKLLTLRGHYVQKACFSTTFLKIVHNNITSLLSKVCATQLYFPIEDDVKTSDLRNRDNSDPTAII